MDDFQPHSAVLTDTVNDGRRDRDASPPIDNDTELERNISRLAGLQLQASERGAPTPVIATLLPELLSIIFFMYAEDNYELSNLRWTRLLFVCQHWHDVGVRTPELWSYIELNDARSGFDVREADALDLKRIGVQRFRAGRWPLTVRIGLFQPLSERKDALLSALWTPPLLSSLTLRGDRRAVQNALQILEAQPHPALTRLVVGSQKRDQPCAIPDVVLGDHTPQLQHLTIDCMIFDWASIQGLRSLHISYKKWFHIAFELSDILEALIRCPLLEHLQIVLPGTFRPEAITGLKDLLLPHIVSISLRGSNELCGFLLHALQRLPRAAKIAISVYDESEHPSSSIPILSIPYLSNHALQPGAPVIRAVGLVKQPRSFPRNPDQLYQFGVTGDIGLDLSISSPRVLDSGPPLATSYIGAVATTHRHAEIDTLNHILRQWPIAIVTHLDVRTTSTIDKDLWEALLTGLPAVTAVLVRPESQATRTLFDVLDGRLRDARKRNIKSIILDFTWTGSHTRMDVDAGYRPAAFARDVLGRVMSYCADAARADVPLDTIEVVNDKRCYFSLVDCSEFSKDLARGFIYRGAVYSASDNRGDA